MSKLHHVIADYDTKIQKAVDLILQYGQIDGSHHKLWVLDQVLRILSDDYEKLIHEYKYQDDDGRYVSDDSGDLIEFYEWDCGIAP